jgi:hypothetical protein
VSNGADDPAIFGKTSSTVRARERAGIGVVDDSLLLSPETAVWPRTAVTEEEDVEEGRRIRRAVSEWEESLIEACGGSGFVTVRPVALGDKGDAIIGAGIVRRFRYVGV